MKTGCNPESATQDSDALPVLFVKFPQAENGKRVYVPKNRAGLIALSVLERVREAQ
jgi:hypothetical protein